MSENFSTLPPHAEGEKIGLFGGSFNPPHDGHRLASLTAIERLGLDRVWWLVTPANPLKDVSELPPLAERIAAAQAIARDKRIVVTGVEADLGTRYTVDTVSALQKACPAVHFVLIFGADIFVELPRWRNWRRLVRLVPLAIIDRPGYAEAALAGAVAQEFAAARLPEAEATRLPQAKPPAWVFLHGKLSPLSSTELRERAAHQR